MFDAYFEPLFEYDYYTNGNQAQKKDSYGETNYTYDGLSRLVTTSFLPVGATEPKVYNYAYDDKNNRKALDVNPESEMQNILSLMGTANTEYSYDLLNRLTQIQQVTDQPDVFNNIEYTYGNSGLRTSKVVNTQATDFVNDGSNIVYEKKYDTATPENISTATYIRGINLICKIEAGAKYFYLYNGHGDVIQIVDNLGNVVNNYNYDEWGNILEENETIQNPFKYAGEYFDNETGYIYLRARYYDPAIGRFINEDSYWGEDNDPLSLNLYTYCANNPIIYVDPSGHFFKEIWSGFQGLVKNFDDMWTGGKLSDFSNWLRKVTGKEPNDWEAAYLYNKAYKHGYDTGTLINIFAVLTSFRSSGGTNQPALVTSNGQIVYNGVTYIVSGNVLMAQESSKDSEITIIVSKSAQRTVKRLSPEAKKGYDKALEALKFGDTRGLNEHPLTGDRKGQWAVDIKGTGRGRGAGRIIYKKLSDEKIEIIEILTDHKY